jgi:hypothetical protein
VTFQSPLPPLPAGSYSVFADVVHASGFTQTMTTTIDVPADSGTGVDQASLSPDDAWGTGRQNADGDRSVLDDGTPLTWLRSAEPLVAGNEASLRFTVSPPPGDTAPLEPYLGMVGHAVVVRDDAQVFIHLHPLGTISMAAQKQLESSGAARVGGASGGMTHEMGAPRMAGDTLYFPYAFPQPGSYTVWVQVKRGGRVLTGSFPAKVEEAAR